MFSLNNAADVMNGNYPCSYRQDRKLPLYRCILASRSLGMNAHGQFLCCHGLQPSYMFWILYLRRLTGLFLCNETMSIYPLGVICWRHLFSLKEGKNDQRRHRKNIDINFSTTLKKIKWTLRICEHVFSMNDSLIHSPCYVFTEARFLVMENSL